MLARRTFRSLRFGPLIWGFHLALPLIGLWLLLGNPGFDVEWRDPLAHFWLVLLTALLSVGLAVLVATGAQRNDDARLYLVALGFTTAAGFLGLHALATPAVVMGHPNAAFNLATPVGVAASAAFAVAATVGLSPARTARVLAWRRRLAALVGLSLAGWAIVQLVPDSPLQQTLSPETTNAIVQTVAVVGIVLFAIAIVRGLARFGQRPSVILISIITAQALLAESLVAMSFAPNWHASWWLWHILMAIAFAYIVYASQVQYRREGTTTTLFTAIAADETLRRLREDYAEALGELVAAIEAAGRENEPVVARRAVGRLQDRFDLSDGQAAVLGEAADALAEERLEGRRLAALVDVGREGRVVLDEATLLAAAEARLQAAFPGDGLAIMRGDDPRLDTPELAFGRAAIATDPPAVVDDATAHRLAIPLRSAGESFGVLVAWDPDGPLSTRAKGILELAANQLAAVLENARLYRQVERLFRAYLSPDVVRTLLADPARAQLGGASTEATILFADLRGYTAFSVGADPAAIVELLNRYFGAVVPLILAEGGTVAQFVGDAIMAIFNAPVAQPDHPLRAARAALAMQRAIEALTAEHPEWPRFRVGIETGPVLVGNLGASEVRTFTAIGETTNLAARLQTFAQAGHIVVGPAAAERLEGVAMLRRLDPIELKGFPDPITSYELMSIR